MTTSEEICFVCNHAASWTAAGFGVWRAVCTRHMIQAQDAMYRIRIIRQETTHDGE